MQISRTNYRRLLQLSGALILAGIIIAYAISRSLNYARGPEIIIFNPSNGSTATSSTITIDGQALRVNKITLNGNPIFIDENGYWKETLIVLPGLNKITVSADDQFGRKTSQTLDLVGITVAQ